MNFKWIWIFYPDGYDSKNVVYLLNHNANFFL